MGSAYPELEKQFKASESLPVMLDFEAQQSEHEWLSWQHFSGGTNARPTNVQMRPNRTRSATLGGTPKSAFPRADQADLQQAFAAFDKGAGGAGPYGKARLWTALLNGKHDEGSWERFGNAAGPGCWSARLAKADHEDADFGPPQRRQARGPQVSKLT